MLLLIPLAQIVADSSYASIEYSTVLCINIFTLPDKSQLLALAKQSNDALWGHDFCTPAVCHWFANSALDPTSELNCHAALSLILIACCTRSALIYESESEAAISLNMLCPIILILIGTRKLTAVRLCMKGLQGHLGLSDKNTIPLQSWQHHCCVSFD